MNIVPWVEGGILISREVDVLDVIEGLMNIPFANILII